MINPMYFFYLRDLGYDKVEGVVALPDAARAGALRAELGYGRVRANRLHVGMEDLPRLLVDMEPEEHGPWRGKLDIALEDAALGLKATIPAKGAPTNRQARRAAIEELGRRYQAAIRHLGKSAD